VDREAIRSAIDHRGADVFVSEQLLHGSDVVAGFEQMSGEGVAEAVATRVLEHAGPKDSGFGGTLQVGLVRLVAA
jgi:hypothetical protein